MYRSCCIAALVACFAGVLSCHSNTTGVQPIRTDSVTTNGHDWVRFGWDVGRSSASTASTGITASNVGSMVRQQVTIPGTVDASAIYLSNIKVGGAAHDVFFVTTTYGKTVAINANTGALLWTYTPTNYDHAPAPK
jgi:glucose dehydrogenase